MDKSRKEFLSILKKEGISYRNLNYSLCGSFKYQRIFEPRYKIKNNSVYDEKNDHYLELEDEDFDLIKKALIKYQLTYST